uniref:MATH domain-containing protein n=1 Tax=Leersia perrieri TaxID=77586 RepID=A0A0D9XUC7_9ORYZ
MSATPLLFAAGGGGRMTRSATSLIARAASAFHVFRIDGYSQTKPSSPATTSNAFLAGNDHHKNWQINFYPNGIDATKISDSISVYLKHVNIYAHTAQAKPVPFQAQYKFSLIDQSGPTNSPPKMAVFGGEGEGGAADGYEEFIKREELERRKDLLVDDCFTVRCDVGVTMTEMSAINDNDVSYGSSDDEDGYSDDYRTSGGHGHRRRRPRRRRDDKEFVKWCAVKKRGGGSR